MWERFACGCGGAGGQSPSIGFPADTCRYRCWPVKTICPLPRTRQFAGLGCPPDTTALNTAIVTQDCRYGQRCNPGHPRPVRSQRQRSQPGGSTWSASFRIPWLPDQARTTRPCRSWPDHRWQTNRWQTQKRCEPPYTATAGRCQAPERPGEALVALGQHRGAAVGGGHSQAVFSFLAAGGIVACRTLKKIRVFFFRRYLSRAPQLFVWLGMDFWGFSLFPQAITSRFPSTAFPLAVRVR